MAERTPSEVWDATAERAGELATSVAEVSKLTLRQRLIDLRWSLPAVAQTAIGAAVAWLVATEVFGHPGAFFAPMSAIIALGLTYGQRTRRALELAFGVALGIGIGDAIIIALGSGAWQLALVVALAMLGAIAVGGKGLVVTQAASSAVLVATIQVPTTFTFTRFVDALIGGTIAVLINLVVSPIDPVALVRRKADPLLVALAATLDDIADVLRRRDHDAAIDALLRARELDEAVHEFVGSVRVSVETARYAPARRRKRGEIARFAAAAPQLDILTRNSRVLARGVLRAVDVDAHVPPEAILAIEDLAVAVRALRDELLHDQAPERATQATLRAAGRTTLVLEETSNLAISVIVGQVRSMSADLLRGIGMTGEESRVAVRRAAGEVAAERLAADQAQAPPA